MAPELVQLRLVTLYLTERCNSRCVSCDYWRHGRQDMALATVQQLLPGLKALGVEQVLLSGGEPLLHPHWVEMATLLRAQGLKLWLLTAGLALAKQLDDVARHVEQVTVSLDGATAASYARIRGLDAFEVVCAGVRAAVRAGLPVTLRVTVQRGNVAELPALVRLAHGLGVNGISFLAADVAHDEAFGRQAPAPDGVALRPEDLPLLAASLDAIEQTHADDLAGGFIAESPAKLRRIEAHARARLGLGPLTAPRCNAPAHSAVIEADGRLRPCFFIGGTQRLGAGGLEAALNAPAERRLRAAIAAGAQAACERCVCAKWFAPA